jgi:ABC-type glycerol-3-phosphate transport system permease component
MKSKSMYSDQTKIHHYKHRRRPNRSVSGDIGIYIFLGICSVIMVFPLFFAISQSLKPLDELFKFPPTVMPRRPTLNNFSDLLVTMSQSWVPFSRYVFNTVLITVVGTFGHVVIASMAAYVLAKYDFPLGKTFFKLAVVALMFTGYVTGIPNYLIMCRLHIVDTYWALILPAIGGSMGLFLMKQFMEGFPMSLIEAAKIDGAREWTIFARLVMPNVRPAWLTISIFSVQALWKNPASTVIYTENKKMLSYALTQVQAGGIARTGQASAVIVITFLVPIIFFIFSQSQVMETMATSGLKD